MTGPKKTQRRSRARSASAVPTELKAPNGDGEGKVKKAMASIEEISASPSEPSAEKAKPEPDGSRTDAEGKQEIPVEQLQQQLVQELNELINRLKELSPAFTPSQIPGAQGLLEATQSILGKANLDKLRSVAGDLLDIEPEGCVVHRQSHAAVSPVRCSAACTANMKPMNGAWI
jgi:hypothetical protein